jgi:hypothetical protein
LLSEGALFNLIQNTPLWMKGVASLDAMSRLALAGQQGIIASPLYTTPTNIIISLSKICPYGHSLSGYIFIFVTD